MVKKYFLLPLILWNTIAFTQEEWEEVSPVLEQEEVTCLSEPPPEIDPCCEEKWYFVLKPGYFFLHDGDMKQFFGMGGFTMRGEFDYTLRGPLLLWIDGGYYQETGTAIGGSEKLQLQLGTLTVGLKWKFDFNSWGSFYWGIGPRLFLMRLQNDSSFVRGEDNAFGIGGGFDAGFWIYPIPQWKNLFLDIYGDYSRKEMHVDPDEVSSIDHDVNLSGFSVGLGLGIRF